MESEKLEDLLLLSLSASKGQRERSEVLDVGVTRDKNLREVIVKYSGEFLFHSDWRTSPMYISRQGQ